MTVWTVARALGEIECTMRLLIIEGGTMTVWTVARALGEIKGE